MCIWPALLSADHTTAPTLQMSHMLLSSHQAWLSLPSPAGNPHHLSPAVLLRQNLTYSSQLGKLPTSAQYHQPHSLALAVQA